MEEASLTDDAYREALDRALKRLRTSDRLESEVRRLLSRFPADVVDRVVATLRSHRMLDDGRVVRGSVESNIGKRAVGDALLQDRLERRGADAAVVADGMADAVPERERIEAILVGKYDPAGDRNKAARFLYGRGFSEEAIREGIEAYFGPGDEP